MDDPIVSTDATGCNSLRTRIEARTHEPAVPVVNKSLHRVFWVPRRYVAIVAATMDGRRFTMRPLAERTHYSLKGARDALWSLHEMGIGTLTTARGCLGYSRFRFNRDCAVVNVSTNVTDTSRPHEEERTLVETFHPGMVGSGSWLT